MTAPARDRTSGRTSKADRAAEARREQRSAGGTGTRKAEKTRSGQRRRSPAVERAYARREGRQNRWVRASPQRQTAPPKQSSRPQQGTSARRPARSRALVDRAPGVLRAVAVRALNTRVTTSRTPFVLTVMVLLAFGLVATLWLSIAAISGSYQLQKAESSSQQLAQYKEQLRERVSAMDSAPALAQQAAQMGMVPAGDPARLVPQSDGSVRVVGEPTEAKPAPPPAPLAPPPPAEPPQKEPSTDQQPAQKQPSVDQQPAQKQPSADQDMRKQAAEVSGGTAR